jgi:hypothetical protein
MAGKTRGPARVPARTVRLARLLIGPNRLRRPSDRLEGFLVMLLAAAFLTAAAAAPFFGERLYESQRTAAARLHPATATLTQSGPSDAYLTPGQAAARWRAPDGQQKKGILTTATAPGISGAAAGARVQVWLTVSGQPEAPPVTFAEAMFSAVVMATAALGAAMIALLICYWLGRLALDRRRLARWASEWSLTGPRWTARRR